MTIYDLIIDNYPSHDFNQCWIELKELIPQCTDTQRVIVALWWSGKQSDIIYNKVFQFFLLKILETKIS